MSLSNHRFPNRFAFTLVELLVVIAIIGVLIGMAVPAMQNMRELARRSNCEHNLMQVSLAFSEYATQFGHYPAGSIADQGPIKSLPSGYHHNWISALLPMLDANTVYQAIDFDAGVYDPANKDVRDHRIPNLLCPSASDIRLFTSCYAGIHSSVETPIDVTNDGVFVLNQQISDHDITDGLAYTMFVGEKLSAYDEDLGWMSGTRSTLRNTGHAINAERTRIRGPRQPNQPAVDPLYVGGLASDHPGGAYALMGSGEIRFLSESMDAILRKQLGARADGAMPQEWKTGEPTEVAPTGPTPTVNEPAAEESETKAVD